MENKEIMNEEIKIGGSEHHTLEETIFQPVAKAEKKELLESLKKSGIIYDYRIKDFTEYRNKVMNKYVKIYIKKTDKGEFEVI